MRFTSYATPDGPRAALAGPDGWIDLSAYHGTAVRMDDVVNLERRAELIAPFVQQATGRDVPLVAGTLAPGVLLEQPGKLLGVGLNYADHASDLGETRPDEPATFMKPATALLPAGGTVPIPPQSVRTTGEAELGIVIGRRCKNVALENAADVIAGFTTVIDMTAEDILQRNPRFLTRAKSFDGFLVLGPDLVTIDELGPLDEVRVTTELNGEAQRSNVVANMMTQPLALVSFFSSVSTLEPGDVISTGTPGAIPLADGDVVACEVSGIGRIESPVRDLKVRP